jgi:hypothetical protein
MGNHKRPYISLAYRLKELTHRRDELSDEIHRLQVRFNPVPVRLSEDLGRTKRQIERIRASR